MNRARAWAVGVPAFYVLAAVVMTFPLALHLDDRIIGDTSHPAPKAEIALEFMTLEEFGRANVPRFYETTQFNYPIGQDMGPRIGRSLNLLAFVPFGLFLPLLPAHNVYVLFLIAAAGMAVYLLARSLRVPRPMALASGLFFLFNGFVALKLDMGFVQKSFYVWLPLALLFLFRTVEHRKPRDAALAGLMLFLMYITYAIYAAWTLIFVGLLMGYVLVFRRDIRATALLALTLAVMGGLSLGVDLIYAQPSGYLLAESNQRAHQVVSGAIPPSHLFKFFIPYPSARFCGLPVFGLLCAVFVGVIGRGRERFILFSILFFVCFLFGKYVEFRGHTYPAPMYLLFEYIPVREAIYTPIRSLPVPLVLMSVCVGQALQLLARPWPNKYRALAAVLGMAIIVAEVRLVFSGTFPVMSSDPGISSFFGEVEDEDFEAFLHLPIVPQSPRNNEALYYYELRTALAGRRMVNEYMNTRPSLMVPDADGPEELRDLFVAQLSYPGVKYVLYHTAVYDSTVAMYERLHRPMPDLIAPEDIAWLADYCGEPRVYDDKGLIVYEIPPPSEAPELTVEPPTGVLAPQPRLEVLPEPPIKLPGAMPPEDAPVPVEPSDREEPTTEDVGDWEPADRMR